MDYWINLIALGAILGATGQMARTIVGMKKMFDAADRSIQRSKNLFETSRLVYSLLVGATAGVLAAVVTEPAIDSIAKSTIFGLIGAGYSGADFIEGILRKEASSISEKTIQKLEDMNLSEEEKKKIEASVKVIS